MKGKERFFEEAIIRCIDKTNSTAELSYRFKSCKGSEKDLCSVQNRSKTQDLSFTCRGFCVALCIIPNTYEWEDKCGDLSSKTLPQELVLQVWVFQESLLARKHLQSSGIFNCQ